MIKLATFREFFAWRDPSQAKKKKRSRQAKKKKDFFLAWRDQRSPVLSKRCHFYHCDVINLLEITTGFTIFLNER